MSEEIEPYMLEALQEVHMSLKKDIGDEHKVEEIKKTVGKEGNKLTPKSHKGQGLAVFTSGGDSQGKILCVPSNVPCCVCSVGLLIIGVPNN